MKTPATLKYTRTDEWVKVEGKTATIGVTDFAQDSLSDIVFFEAVVSSGDDVNANSQIGTLESVKAAADVSTPVSGKVVGINSGLSSAPELVNSDPYEQAWMIRIEMSDPAELSALMDAGAYDAYCAGRNH